MAPELVTASFSKNLASIGLGYAIAISLGFLVFFSAIILLSYLCCRSATLHRHRQTKNPNPNCSNENNIYLSRIIFIVEDDESGSSQNTAVGLDQVVINSYPKLVFTKRNENWGNDVICSICLCEYREAEMLRMLPDCKHYVPRVTSSVPRHLKFTG